MRTFFILALVAIAACSAVAFETDDDGVIIGTDATFDAIVSENEFVLVEFYAPWCGHCKQLAPEYAKAAKELAKLDAAAKLCKVDATEQPKKAEEHGVQGYPTLKFFRAGQATEYTGGRTSSDIVSWLQKKSGPVVTTVTTVGDIEALQKGASLVAIGFFSDADSEEAKEYEAAAAAIDDVVFAQVFAASEDVFKHYNAAAPLAILHRDFDDEDADVRYSDEFYSAELEQFVRGNSLPLVIEFTDAAAQKIFGGDIKVHMILFVEKSSAEYDNNLAALKEAAVAHKGKCLFVYIDCGVDEHTRIMEYFGITKAELPAATMINLADDMAKYRPADRAVTGDVLKAFVQEFADGSLKKHLMTEATPEDWNAKPVKVLTGGNFAEVALNADADVLVEFYAPWCGHCKQLVPIWDALGEAVEGDDSVVIAKMDSTANELEGLKVEGFPTIKFFPKGTDTIEAAVDYEGGRDLSSLISYLNDKASKDFAVPEEGAGDGDEVEDGHDEL